MIRSRAAFIFSLLMLSATPAWAATLTMLQFGSFETRSEAEARATAIKQKHAGIIGAMDVSIREIKLPPDNLPVYRTQAGPVANKAAAQSICAQLLSNGDECFVVETAMLDSSKLAVASAAPVSAANRSQPLPNTAPAVATSVTTTAATDTMDKPYSSPVAARDPQSVSALAGVSAAPAAVAALSSPTPSQKPNAPLSAPARPALAPLSDTPPDTESPAPAPAPNSPEMQAALDRAVANESTVAASLATPAATSPAPAPQSFWSRLNPFSDSPAADKPNRQTPPPPMPVAAAVSPVSEAALPPTSLPPAPQPAELPAPAALPAASAAPVALAAAPVPEQPAPVMLAAAPAPAPTLQLPPPPAPLKGFDAPRPPVNVAMPEPTGSIVPAPMPVAAAALPPAGAPGSVRVEEARRVPLTENTQPPAPSYNPAVPVLPLSPSATLGQKTIWAQMGPFADTQDALAFWDQYRQQHPDFPVVRVRVTSSLLAQNHGDTSQWLRIGPFAREGFVSSLCAGMVNAQGEPLREGLRCGRVIDLGVASTGTRMPGYLPGSRYSR